MYPLLPSHTGINSVLNLVALARRTLQSEAS